MAEENIRYARVNGSAGGKLRPTPGICLNLPLLSRTSFAIRLLLDLASAGVSSVLYPLSWVCLVAEAEFVQDQLMFMCQCIDHQRNTYDLEAQLLPCRLQDKLCDPGTLLNFAQEERT